LNATVTVKSNGPAVSVILKGLSARAAVTVGVHAEDGSQDHGGMTTAELATIHEFGATGSGVNIPARSWLRDYVEANEPRHLEMLRRVAAEGIKGHPMEQAMGQLGAQLVGEVKERIIAGIAPPNAESTIARKGSETPLIDTGQFIGSIHYQVER